MIGSESFQKRVASWAIACFGVERAEDSRERNFRFIEEALELVQANGCTKEEAQRILEYVYNRPPGELYQEVGGVAVTLAALCAAARVDLQINAEREIARCHERILHIRQKNLNKPDFVQHKE